MRFPAPSTPSRRRGKPINTRPARGSARTSRGHCCNGPSATIRGCGGNTGEREFFTRSLLHRTDIAMTRLFLITLMLALPFARAHAQFDRQHKAWGELLKKHVVLIDGGKASQVRYAELARDRAALTAYLASLSRVSEAEFKSWGKEQQLAFLINAYNAHMVELILTRYPNIKSVWDFGKIFNNPFKNKFFTLFGREFSLDNIEHDTIRAKGVYDDPRIHFAVSCASI